ncbi:MAG TPA: NAD(P)H-quinone oxidoreductase [Gemmatimonadaceae bacterium]|jgi:putative PIG3 family NAD(P)H quinone oxidoreductase|nr:NAD(P)H-quinone oxidoreductase [Gemmatimonadaceae bacterium]
MKAVIITRPGGPEVLEIQERPQPEPGIGQIRVRVHASALNRADLMQREGNYPVPPGVSAEISGMEYAGEVDALGPAATLWKLGDRVMGIIAGAGHAEYLCVHEREAIPVPKALSWEEAAAIPEAFLTAYDALFNRLSLHVGETALIHAVGSGVGTAALQIARVAGASVVGTARSAEKLERAKKLGLDLGIDASRGDWATQVEAAIGAERVHAVLDLVGGSYLEGNLRVLGPLGRIVVVGLTAGAVAPFNMGVLLRKRLTIVGTMLRGRPVEEKIALAREFSERIVPLFAAGRLKPVIDRVFPFNEIRAAHELMESNKTFGKIVLRWD